MRLHLLSTKNLFIYSQLQYEEALLRLDNRSWCFLNIGSPKALVLGVSKKAEEELSFSPLIFPSSNDLAEGGAFL